MSVLSHHVVGTLKCKQIGSRVGVPAPPPPLLAPCGNNKVIKGRVCDAVFRPLHMKDPLPVFEKRRVVIVVADFLFSWSPNPTGIQDGRPWKVPIWEAQIPRTQKRYLEAVWKVLERVSWMLNYHTKPNQELSRHLDIRFRWTWAIES